ncbi:MAG: hypothetical protein HY672_02585 [Chloroflexi bacterium]|nr:hypothetical protein [Chloroflexota bacterium]
MMQEKPNPVSSYNQVAENVRCFNAGLLQGTDLETLLAYFRAWYYLPEEDAVGPSKFIGYEGMTGIAYMERDDLDGRETEPVLHRWFEMLEKGTPEHQYVEQKVLDLAARFGKRVSSAARFSAPSGWRVSAGTLRGNSGRREWASPGGSLQTTNGHNESEAMVEVFVRAFGTLRPSEQAAVLRRIEG